MDLFKVPMTPELYDANLRKYSASDIALSSSLSAEGDEPVVPFVVGGISFR